ncbi:MAG: hypothetical protein ACFWTN_07570 [Clostridium sp.]|jgi:hypothetical protein
MSESKSFRTNPSVATVIVQSIADAAEQVKEEIAQQNFITGNGTPGRFWDFVNTNLCKKLGNVNCKTHITKRGYWATVLIYESKPGYIYTLMRENRYSQVSADILKRKNMHYIDILSHYVNADLLAYPGQLRLYSNFQDEDRLKEKFTDLIQDSFGPVSDIKRYVLVLFDASQGELHSVRAVTLDANLDIVDEANWSDYIPVNESIIVSTVSDPHDPANHPTHNLTLQNTSLSRVAKRSGNPLKKDTSPEKTDTAEGPINK